MDLHGMNTLAPSLSFAQTTATRVTASKLLHISDSLERERKMELLKPAFPLL